MNNICTCFSKIKKDTYLVFKGSLFCFFPRRDEITQKLYVIYLNTRLTEKCIHHTCNGILMVTFFNMQEPTFSLYS